MMPIRLTPVIKTILFICLAAFVVQQTADQFFGAHLMELFSLNSWGFLHKYYFWQIFTYPLIHHDVMHFFFNMMMLAFVGSEIEAVWGSKKIIKYSLFCTITAGFAFLFIQFMAQQLSFGSVARSGLMCGATSAIYGLLMAYGIIFGERVLLFMMLFPLKAKHFVWVLILLELFTTLYSGGGGFAGIAHLIAIGAGLSYIWLEKAIKKAQRNRSASFSNQLNLPAKTKLAQKRKANHLKLIVNQASEFGLEDSESENSPKTWH